MPGVMYCDHDFFCSCDCQCRVIACLVGLRGCWRWRWLRCCFCCLLFRVLPFVLSPGYWSRVLCLFVLLLLVLVAVVVVAAVVVAGDSGIGGGGGSGGALAV